MQLTVYHVGMSLAERLTGFRKLAGLNQKELAKRASVSEATVSRIEAGIITDPRHDMLVALSTALGVTVSDLVGDSEAGKEEADPDFSELQLNALAIKKMDPEVFADVLRQLAERREYLELKEAERRRAERNRPPKAPKPE